MLFQRDTIAAIAGGRVTVAFRRWRRPTVRTGGTLQTRAGLLAIESVERISEEEISDDDVVCAGYTSRDEVLLALAAARTGELYRVRFRLAGPDPGIALREAAELSAADVGALKARLQRLDRASKHGPWTAATLQLIAERPAVRAGVLAEVLGRERLPFKADVRKLKAMGLTESLEVGYRLSPRGRALLHHLHDQG
ncbi:MAG: hypothetical protein M0R74_12025 [Dehalococcoidia bacterium]|nr:hypothetical protein [Dehalococcoidia bacterium]